MSTHDHDAPDAGVRRRAAPTPRAVDDGGPAQLAATIGNTSVNAVLRRVGRQTQGATGAQQLDESVARAIEARKGGGAPLDDGVREELEPVVGADLSGVRVHTDNEAHELNQAVSARAFTTGSDLFFSHGTYDPSSSDGKGLLAHELTHVVQQESGTSGLRGGEVSHPNDPAERHAESVGQAVASGRQTAEGGADGAAPAVARQGEEEEELMASRQAAEEEELMASRQAVEEEEELMQG